MFKHQNFCYGFSSPQPLSLEVPQKPTRQSISTQTIDEKERGKVKPDFAFPLHHFHPEILSLWQNLPVPNWSSNVPEVWVHYWHYWHY